MATQFVILWDSLKGEWGLHRQLAKTTPFFRWLGSDEDVVKHARVYGMHFLPESLQEVADRMSAEDEEAREKRRVAQT